MKKFLVGTPTTPIYIEAETCHCVNSDSDLVFVTQNREISRFRDWTFYYEMPEQVEEKKAEA